MVFNTKYEIDNGVVFGYIADAEDRCGYYFITPIGLLGKNREVTQDEIASAVESLRPAGGDIEDYPREQAESDLSNRLAKWLVKECEPQFAGTVIDPVVLLATQIYLHSKDETMSVSRSFGLAYEFVNFHEELMSGEAAEDDRNN